MALRGWLFAVAIFSLPLGWRADATAQEPAAEGPVLNCPADPGAWINSGPITAETLKGKSALFYFFEEGCPQCRSQWPTMVEVAKRFEDKPIVFIAVNSGNSREDLTAYAKDVKLNWPILVDTNRQFEKDAGLTNEISLQNIYQVRLVTADGKMHQGDWNDVSGSATKALEGAKWKIDRASVPNSLHPVLRGLEFNMMSAVPGPLKAGLSSEDPAVKASADQLNALVQAKIAAEVQAAKAVYASGDKWKSYKMVSGIAVQYAGLELPESVNKAKTALAADEAVRNQLTAQRELDALKKRARTAPPSAQRGLVLKLKELTEKYGETEAGVEAKALLATAPQN
jgi:thiol-disulfide isomerase/thioredoxin